jgi:NitT/TauT family transport system permease protein
VSATGRQACTVLNYPDVFVGIITIGARLQTAAAIELIGRRNPLAAPR